MALQSILSIGCFKCLCGRQSRIYGCMRTSALFAWSLVGVQPVCTRLCFALNTGKAFPVAVLSFARHIYESGFSISFTGPRSYTRPYESHHPAHACARNVNDAFARNPVAMQIFPVLPRNLSGYTK
eukprot:6187122-Pleurochrysis_carterae.AAC.2